MSYNGNPLREEVKEEIKEDANYNSFNSVAAAITPASSVYMNHTGKLNMRALDPVTNYASSGVFPYQTEQSVHPGRGGRGRGFSQRGLLGNGGNRGRGRGRPGTDMGIDRDDGRNAIQTLQIRCRRDNMEPPVYTDSAQRLMNVAGAVLTYTVEVAGKTFTAEGSKILHAKNAAAYKALESLGYDRLQHLKQTTEAEAEAEKIARVKEAHLKAVKAKELKEEMKLERLKQDDERRALKLQREEEKLKAKSEILKKLESQSPAKKIKSNSGSSLIPDNHVAAIEGIEHLSGIIDSLEQWQNIFGIFSQIYGPIELTSDWSYHADASGNTYLSSYTYNLKCQGNTFTGNSINKKEARRIAAKNGMIFFKNNPPPIINDLTKRKKISQRKTKPERPLPNVAIDDPFSENLAKMCLDFTSKLMADIPIIYTNKLRELCLVVKVYPGADAEDVSNCDIVALGNGGAVCKLENITEDGSLINDCSGDTLVIRAFRRYLLGQVEAIYKEEESIFVKNGSDRLKLNDSISFRMILARAPQGDAYVFPKPYRKTRQEYFSERRRLFKESKENANNGNKEKENVVKSEASAVDVETERAAEPAIDPVNIAEKPDQSITSTEPADTWVLLDSVEAETADPSSSEPAERETSDNLQTKEQTQPPSTIQAAGPSAHVKEYVYAPMQVALGQIHWWMQRCSYSEKFHGYMLQVPSDDNKQYCNQIVSPCDKLALKTATGVQGGLLSHLIEPVHFTHYIVAGNMCNQEALSRALYGRLEGIEIAISKPQIVKLKKVNFLAQLPASFSPRESHFGRSDYAHIWAKGCELDILLPCSGMCMPLESLDTHDEEKKELEAHLPSSYNSLKYYQRFSELCKHLNIEVGATSGEMKRSMKEYTEAKQAVKDKLQADGHGSWPVKSVERKF